MLSFTGSEGTVGGGVSTGGCGGGVVPGPGITGPGGNGCTGITGCGGVPGIGNVGVGKVLGCTGITGIGCPLGCPYKLSNIPIVSLLYIIILGGRKRELTESISSEAALSNSSS